MKLKSLLIGTVLAATSITSYAAGDSQNVNVALVGTPATGYSSHFGLDHLVVGTFTDVFTFSPSVGPSLLNVWVQTMSLGVNHDIDFYSADLNGNALTFTPNGGFEAGWLNPTSVSGPLVLTVSGMANTVTASYSGTLNVDPVPEPETYIMMLGGLGILSFIGRRRKKS
ncbi:PEP-CTERM sorting domain-containing protein [Duganella sp. BJB488]|uniref:FxDxF family PEP-CTERM protein n=1 Tax=unclassified Duganella TaxID=2636909 RepID=UPI000E352AA9|nr:MULTISPECIES: FxDxF family PEP-CTERM protein [unclassified Duganella]RFP11107.1 PEP-CTERM sorting domain-containing protein [Duganella sp. BJB489]RFP14344.1 PEP-CTERM sorting domain-containing protein [Duganella sp. BJB488]RFP30280.1 PEP-CTERM sorting domain-containing protein [Duganella sp. BJB480]